MLCAIACTALLAGCSSTVPAADTPAGTTTTTTLVARAGGTLSLGIDQPFTGCNPNTATGSTWANQTVLEAVLPSAFVVSPTGQEVLDQAVVEQAEPVSLSPETIAYTINPDAVWSDGVPITAADFIYAWHQQRGATRTAPAADATTSTLGYRDIKSVKGSHHGRTVTVVFRTLYADWQVLFHQLLPAHVMTKVGWDVACNAPDPAIDLSGGPFRIVSAKPDQVVLGPNARWWGDPPPQLHRVRVDVARSTPELSEWLANGHVQVVQPASFGPGFLEAATTSSTVESSLQVGTTFLELQFATTSVAFQNATVRQAVARSINRQGLVNQVVAFASHQIGPASSHLYAQSQSQYPIVPTGATPPFPLGAEATEAAKLFASAGYTRSASGAWLGPYGTPLVLRLTVDAGNGWALTTSHHLVRQLERAGIGVTVSEAPTDRAAGTALATGTADLALLPMHASFPTQALAWYTPILGSPGQGGSEDWSQLDDPTLTATLAKAAEELNPATAQPMYQKADQLLWNAMAALPLFTVPTATAWSDRAGGAGPNRFGSLLWYAQSWSILVPSTTSATTTSTAPPSGGR